ncbi:MAG: NAD(P)-dependent glycerol-3-phosphate dehydrogenase [Thermoleophilia bacterium]|nr:NAD(P)-dependent glycerol-3-phosphate dehydrogenase [Thermoleophilia bacterium]
MTAPAMRAVVVGGGSWGTAFATLLRDGGHSVTLACRDPEQVAAIAATHRNPRYAQGVDLGGIDAAELHEAPLAEADLIVVAVPSRAFRDVVQALPGTAPILSLTKGLDPETGERLSTLVRGRPVAVLSGPNIAGEIVRGLPAATVIASDDEGLALELQRAVNSPVFRVYVNDDVSGVEYCAAAKNVIALAAGGADGLGLGANAKSGLVTRGLAEMRRLADAAGAKAETFAGLAGMGDLVVTCWSAEGRNRRAGELIAQGATPAEAAAAIGQVVEGLTTAPVLRDLSRRLGVEMPITEGVCAVLAGESLTELVGQLMRREPTSE